MDSYYSDKLSAERLKLCYDLAPAPVRKFLDVENEYVRQRIQPGFRVLELGCGYGRVLKALEASTQGMLIGIDISFASLRMAQDYLGAEGEVGLIRMDGGQLAFPDAVFDLVCCIQNGISAFHMDQRALICGAARITRPGGRVLFSSYAAEFWEDRLNWFRLQADRGLIGEIDERATGNGRIVCRDGFTATTVDPEGFKRLARGIGHKQMIETVASCSVFCEIFI